MASVSDLDRVLARFEDERQARCRKAAVLKQKRDNVLVYLELLAIPPTQLNTNAAKRRAQHILFPIKDYSLELFVLCALATNQRTLARVKWTRDEVTAVLRWWDQAEQPLTELKAIWQSLEISIQCTKMRLICC